MTSRRPSISAAHLDALTRFAEAKNLDIAAIQSAQSARGIEMQDGSTPEESISCVAFVALVEALAEEAHDDAFGLHVIESMSPRPSGVFQHIIFNSRTLREAFQAISRFLGLVTDAFNIRYEEAGNIGWMIYECPFDLGLCSQFVDGQVGLIAVRARHLLGENCTAVRVELERPEPASTKEFKRVFGVLPKFNQPANRIGFDVTDLVKPLPLANPEFLMSAHDYGCRLLGIKSEGSTLSLHVAKFIVGALQRGDASEARACVELAMTARTLQRNLAAEGTTFKALLDETRARLARHYLIGTDLSLTAIAFLLGYSELSAFSRAAKVWLGESPSALRKRNRPDGAADRLPAAVAGSKRKRQPASS